MKEKEQEKDNLYDKKIFTNLSIFFKKNSNEIISLLGLGSFFGFCVQIIYLIVFDAIEFFSRSQVISDGAVIMFMIVVFFLTLKGILSLYNKHKDRLYTILGLLLLIIVFIIPQIWEYFLNHISLLVIIIPIFMAFFLSLLLYHKLTKNEISLDLKNGYVITYMLLGLLVILLYYYPIYFTKLNVNIDDKLVSVKYMNDVCIVTDSGIIDKNSGLIFSRNILSGNINNYSDDKQKNINTTFGYKIKRFFTKTYNFYRLLMDGK